MPRRSAELVTVVLIAVLVPLAFASVALGAGGKFGCAATSISETSGAPPKTVPTNAAGGTPCVARSATSVGSSAPGPVQFSHAAAFTHTQRHLEAPGAGALAAVGRVTISGAGDQVVIGGAQARASFACIGGSAASVTASQLASLTVNGKPVALATPTTEVRLSLDKSGSYVQTGVQTTSVRGVNRAAVFVHLVGVGDFRVAVAGVSEGGSPCSRAHGLAPAETPCPSGSGFDPTTNTCTITQFTKRPIAVTSPFGAPLGGVVESVARARATLRGVHCLSHRRHGRYVILGVGSGGLITGTSGADRIITIGGSYTIEGKGGNDCISVGGGNVTIHDGNGKVTVFGGSGTDTIRLGNGNDNLTAGSGTTIVKLGGGNDRVLGGTGSLQLHAGNGKDFIQLGPGRKDVTVGNGNDTIYGGPGVDVIHAGNGNDTILAAPGVEQIFAGTGADLIVSSAGFDMITALGPGAQVRCAPGRDQVVVNPAAVAYAKHHGCTLVSAR